jgi:predicted ATPase
VHFERGRDTKRAIHYLQQAGENALRRSAYPEAITLLTKGLELLATLPDTPERAQQELTLQLSLSAPLEATKGYAAPEVERTWSRARDLCQQVDETPQFFQVLNGLYVFSSNRAEFHTAHELAKQLLALARSGQNPARLPYAYLALGTTLFRHGELVPAREHLEQSLALFDVQKHHLSASLASSSAVVGALAYMAWVLWYLGYPTQALQKSHEAVALAQELAHPFSIAFALSFTVRLHQLRREGQVGQERAEAVIAFSNEHGFPFWLTQANILRGWALAEQGQHAEGVAQMHRSLAAFRATGAETGRSWYLALLAEAYERVEQAAEGLSMLAEALPLVDKTGERMYEAELYRLKGELTLAQSRVQSSVSRVRKSSEPGVRRPESLNPSTQHPTPSTHVEAEQEAERYFLKAIDIARQQQAKSWELRAVMSLSRLWHSQGKKDAGRKMLAEIYGWFTEGFDTTDLQEAKSFLEGVSRTLD